MQAPFFKRDFLAMMDDEKMEHNVATVCYLCGEKLNREDIESLKSFSLHKKILRCFIQYVI